MKARASPHWMMSSRNVPFENRHGHGNPRGQASHGGVDIQTSSSGTSVDLWQRLPRGVFLNSQETEAIVTSLKTTAPENPLDELAVQNRDLVSTLDQMSAQSMTLEQVNEELRETNRGVVALYDELDTVHRVGRVVASKLDLDSLSRAITDATTELSGAEFGAFLILSTRNNRLVWQCVSGPLVSGFPDFPPPDIENLMLDEDSDIFGLDEIKDRLPFANSLGLQRSSHLVFASRRRTQSHGSPPSRPSPAERVHGTHGTHPANHCPSGIRRHRQREALSPRPVERTRPRRNFSRCSATSFAPR